MQILQSHGAGGESMNRLIADSILKHLSPRSLGAFGLSDLDDGASISLGDVEIVIRTVRSYDPCLACTVHVMTPHGQRYSIQVT